MPGRVVPPLPGVGFGTAPDGEKGPVAGRFSTRLDGRRTGGTSRKIVPEPKKGMLWAGCGQVYDPTGRVGRGNPGADKPTAWVDEQTTKLSGQGDGDGAGD